MVIKVLPYRRSIHVTEVFEKLKESLGDEEFSRLFQAIITDNGSEFSDPESIEISTKTGEKLSSVFYCDPNSSWQKGCIEKNTNTFDTFCLKELHSQVFRNRMQTLLLHTLTAPLTWDVISKTNGIYNEKQHDKLLLSCCIQMFYISL